VKRVVLELQDGPGGWVEAVVSEEGSGEFASFFVRFRPDGQSGWSLDGALYVPGLSPVTLRALPLNRIQLAVNASDSLRKALARRLQEPVPEVRTQEFVGAFTSWVHEEPELALERPKGRALSDDFFAKVADTYRSAMTRGLPPRTAVADAAGVSTDVAGRWVREARKRKYLPATHQGKVKA
jgi:hypothetical protein